MDNQVRVVVELIGNDKAMADLKKLKSLIDEINRSGKISLNFDTKGLATEISNLTKAIESLTKQKFSIDMDDKQIEELQNKVVELERKLEDKKKVDVDTQNAVENLQRLESIATGVANNIASVFSGLSDISVGIGNAFGAMADVFSNDFTTYVKRSLTYLGTKAVTSRIEDIISRYDIMSTFTDYMELAGVSADKAAESLDRVDQSIRGIPIGLDEAAFRLRRYQMYLNDIERATNLTIGLQRAIVAGGASEQMQTTAYTQIDRLLATGKLAQSRQWIALFNGLGVSLRFLKEELALDPTADMKTIAADLASGRIAADDFLRAIERLATNEDLSRAIEIYKSTISAWMANIGNAIKRGGENVLKNLNRTMFDTFGTGITGVLKNIRDEIDTVSKSMGNFIRQNPENLQKLAGAFSGILERFGSFNFGDFISNVIERLGQLADIFRRIFDAFPAGFMEDFASFAMVLAGPLSKIFTAAASGAGVIIGIFERFKDFDFGTLIDKIVTQIERMARVVESVLTLIPDGLLGDLMAFALVWGKPLAAVISGIGGALGGLFASMRGVKAGTGGTLLSEIILLARSSQTFRGFLGISAFASAISAIGFALSSYFNAKTEKGLEVLKELTDLDFKNLAKDAENMTKGIRESLNGFDDQISEFYTKAETIRSLAAKIRDTNETLKTDSNKQLIDEQKRNLQELKELADINIKYDADTGLLLEEGDAVRHLSEDYINLAVAKQEAELLTSLRSDALANMIEAEANVGVISEQLSKARREYDKLQRWVQGHPMTTAQRGVDTTTIAPVLDEAGNIVSSGVTAPSVDISDMPKEYADDFAALAQASASAKDSVADLEAQLELADKAAEEASIYYEQYGIQLNRVEAKIRKMKRDGTMVIDLSGQQVAFEDADENLQNILAAYSEFAEGAREAIDSVITGFSEMEAAATVAAETIRNNLETQLSYITNLNNNLEEVLKFVVLNFGTERGRQASAFLKEVMEDPAAYAGELAGVAEALKSEDWSILDSMFGTYGQIEDKKIQYENLVSDLNTLLNDPENGLVAILNNPELTDGGMLKSILSEEDYNNLMQMYANVTEEVVADTAEMQQSTDNLGSSVENAGAKADTTAGQLERMADRGKAKIVDIDNFSSKIGVMAGNLGAAMGAAAGLASAIDSIPSHKEVQVTYTQTTQGFAGGYNIHSGGEWVPMFESKGGMIPQYYANGRFVKFMPRGTDTVPAMLTPGEYVMRKSAAQMWGKPLLDALNNRDAFGAVSAMFNRLAPNGGTTNYYRDNHASVVQNFYGNTGQGYSQRLALRSIGAL